MTTPTPHEQSIANRAVLFLIASLIAAASANAGVIAWSAPQSIVDDNDVSTAGTLVVAHNLGSFGNSSATLNGVEFTPFATSAPVNTQGAVTLSSSGVIYGDNFGFGEVLPPFTDLSPDYQTLLQSGSFTFDFPPPNISLKLNGLTPGRTYQFQWWANQSNFFTYDPNSPAPPLLPTTTATAGDSVTLERSGFFSGSTGQYAIGVFTADTTSQEIIFSGSFTQTVLNAFQLRELPSVPEPGSCLFGLALTGALLRSRFRRQA